MTATFQEGNLPDSSYSGTSDTTLSQNDGDNILGAEPECYVDGDNPAGSGQDALILMRWDISSIPTTAVIESISIDLYATDASDFAYPIFAVSQSWDENAATYNNSGSITTGAQIGTVSSSKQNDWATIALNDNAKALVQQWVQTPDSNFGIMIADSAETDGLDIACSEYSAKPKRPVLQVEYRTP